MAITSASNPATSKHEPQVVFIKPSKGWVSLNLRTLWEYRELLYFLTWRDIKVRYKQTALGAAWAILQPMATVLIFLVLMLLNAYYRTTPTINIVWTPLFLALAFVTSLGVGLWMSALNVKY